MFQRYKVMRKWWLCVFTLPILCLFVGCTIFAQDDNEWSVGFESTLVFRQTGPKDVDRRAEWGLDAPEWMRKSVVDWIYTSQQTPTKETIEELNSD